MQNLIFKFMLYNVTKLINKIMDQFSFSLNQITAKDSIDSYFECISECSIVDGHQECITRCLEVHLKGGNNNE